jgi:peptidoglycan biosynthesis protein MviN/MurJ (putative lipid II flippase)
MLLMGLAQLLITSTLPIDQAFASHMGQGAVATLGFANRTLTLTMTLGTVMISRALLPVLSRMAASGEVELARRQTLQWSGLLFGFAVLGAAVVWAIAPELVRLLFQRGEFNSQASARVTEALRYGIVQLPPFFGGIALVQLYSATGRFRSFLFITFCALLAKVGLNVVLTPIYGLGGIMISTGCMYLMTGLLLWMGLTRSAALATGLPRRRRDSGHPTTFPWDAR